MISIDQSKCIGCGQCVKDCITNKIILENDKAQVTSDCILCGHCVAICPTNAVAILEYEMSDVEEYDNKRFGFDIGNLLHTIKFRRSIRDFKEQAVEQPKLESIIQAGRYTATGSNVQGCRFIVIQEGLSTFKDLIWNGINVALETTDAFSDQMSAAIKNFSKMRATGTDYLFRNAPTVIYVAAESTVDAALAAQNMELAAIAQGLGILYNGFLVYSASMNPAACQWLDVDKKPIAVCMLVGYPNVSYQRTAPRRTADVRWR